MSLLTEVQSGWAQGAAPPSSASRNYLAQPAGIELAGADYAIVGVVMVIALAALAFGYVLIREVLSAGQGTSRMKDIAKAVQEGASAYLNRQFRTLAVFAAAWWCCCSRCPPKPPPSGSAAPSFFLLGAVFSAATGYLGMWLAVRGQPPGRRRGPRVGGRDPAMRIAFAPVVSPA